MIRGIIFFICCLLFFFSCKRTTKSLCNNNDYQKVSLLGDSIIVKIPVNISCIDSLKHGDDREIVVTRIYANPDTSISTWLTMKNYKTAPSDFFSIDRLRNKFMNEINFSNAECTLVRDTILEHSNSNILLLNFILKKDKETTQASRVGFFYKKNVIELWIKQKNDDRSTFLNLTSCIAELVELH